MSDNNIVSILGPLLCIIYNNKQLRLYQNSVVSLIYDTIQLCSADV